MTPKTRVAVCGSSLYMASLAAGLKANPALDVIRIPVVPSDLPARLRDLAPAVVVIDLDQIAVDLPLALLRQHPGLLLLGMDPTSDELLVLSGHSALALSIADLVNLIEH